VSRLLLDTNVAVWLLLGDRDRITETAVTAMEDEQNEIAISAMNVLEIAIKRSLGKLTIEDGWAAALTRLGFDPLPVTSIHAEAVESLPWHHRDPFDRVLVAQASVEHRTLVSADPRLAAYDVDVLW
jgi:PIN domain nuclease of toxin-antitoxin system